MQAEIESVNLSISEFNLKIDTHIKEMHKEQFGPSLLEIETVKTRLEDEIRRREQGDKRLISQTDELCSKLIQQIMQRIQTL